MLFTGRQNRHDVAGFRLILWGTSVRLRYLFCVLVLLAGLFSAPALLRAMEEAGDPTAAAVVAQTAEKPARSKPVYEFNRDGQYRGAPRPKGANQRPAHQAVSTAPAPENTTVPDSAQSMVTCIDQAALDSAPETYVPDDASGPFGAKENAVTAQSAPAYIAIVIDDVGVDYKRSARAINLPGEVTLAFLPYAKGVKEQAVTAAVKGHELMVHLPMEPQRMTANPGDNYLAVEHTAEELEKRIHRNLDAFDGYKGVNNHMGSAFTRYAPGLEVLMTALKKRGVYFLDSKTAPDSVAETIARRSGVPATHRDVFLDHYETPEKVLAALEQVERIARAGGFAVAIGHPKDVTLDALEQWLPTLAAKNIEVIPMSKMIKKRHAAHKAHSAAAPAQKPVAAASGNNVE